jgi:hypothetical protein
MKIINIPKEIFLQIGECLQENEEIDFKELKEVSWHTSRIFYDDIKYYSEEEVIEMIIKAKQ